MRPGSPLLQIILAVMITCWASRASEQGVVFIDRPLKAVLQQARVEHKRIMVEVWASWCAPCHTQAREIFSSGDGERLTRDLLAWKADFDAPRHQSLMKRWNILRLPTVLFLRPDGTEIDRIEGYTDKEKWLMRARAAASGIDPTDSIRNELLNTGDLRAAHAQQLRLRLGHAMLVRGETDRGIAQLKATIDSAEALGPSDRTQPAETALFYLGRYYARVRNDHAMAAPVWRQLLQRYPDGSYASGAAWWLADASERQARPRTADADMVQFVGRQPSVERMTLAIQWMEKTGRPLTKVRDLLLRAHLPQEARKTLLLRYDTVALAVKK